MEVARQEEPAKNSPLLALAASDTAKFLDITLPRITVAH